MDVVPRFRRKYATLLSSEIFLMNVIAPFEYKETLKSTRKGLRATSKPKRQRHSSQKTIPGQPQKQYESQPQEFSETKPRVQLFSEMENVTDEKTEK